MRSHTAEITDYLQAKRPDIERFLADLVRAPSDNPPGDCAPHAERAAALLRGMGWDVELHRVPDRLVRANGMISCANLIVRQRFGDGPIIALNAHGDVVPPGQGWAYDPYGAEVSDGWMHGRGVAVSKSDFATYAFALAALVESGLPLQGAVELHFTYDEETGGEIGPAWLIDQGLTKPDLTICAGFSYAVVTAHNGCLHLEVEVQGRSAHAAMPATGIDALAIANEILSALYDYREGLSAKRSSIPGIGAPQMTVGLISGGINTNVVPDRVTFRLDRRIIVEESSDEVEAELHALIESVAARHPEARIKMTRIMLARPLSELPGGRRLSERLCHHASRIMGEPVHVAAVPLYTDARHYAAQGIPTVLYGAGPRSIEEANAHRADERLLLSDLGKASAVVALTLADMLRL